MILRRLVGAVVTVIVVATLGFFALRAAPGNPFEGEKNVSKEVRENIRKRYHLDDPLWKQYTTYMTGLVTRGDLGYSQKRPISVNELVENNFPKSFMLGVLALFFAVGFGLLFGVIAAARQNTWADHGAMSFALAGISVPMFVLGPILLLWFSLRLGWFPAARWEGFMSMVLPALSLGLIYMGTIARLTRGGMLETMRQDYVRTARAKGLSEAVVVWKHAFRLGVMPVVTYIGPAFAYLITGGVVVETIFQVPGLGFYLISSITDRDFPVLTGIAVFYCGFVILVNFLVDVTYGILDPRIREARA